jgi:hypothetical protein
MKNLFAIYSKITLVLLNEGEDIIDQLTHLTGGEVLIQIQK